MSCPECRQELVPNANFCHACGFMLQAYCRPCRHRLPPNSQFCFECGSSVQLKDFSVRESSPTLFTPPPTPNPQPSGERKHVSVLFADLSGFTAMSERLDPERVTEIVNSCFDRLGKVVYSFEGYIDKFMGDCIMALFGAPIAHENDPELAIRCGLALLRELENFNKESGQNLGMSIGINSGLVVAGQVGTEKKLEYTVMGDAVNLAQRLQSTAESGQILVSEAVYKACQKLFEFDALPPVSLKGKEKPVEVFRVIREKLSTSSQKELSSTGFVGREVEIDLITKLLDQSMQGQFSLLGVAGEAGVGKSRLKYETKKIAKSKKISWFEAKCDRFNRESPYFLFQQLVREILKEKNLDESPLDDISKALLSETLHLDNVAPQTFYLDANQRKQSIFVAMRRLLDWFFKDRSSVLYLEDLHWIDPLSLELFEFVLPELSKLSLFAYGSFRPDFNPPWKTHKDFQLIRLEPLSADKAVELGKSILKVKEIPTELEQLIREKSDGNPLYVEEIIKSLVDQGKIQRSGDAWTIHADLSGAQVPTTLQGLIASRIDKLDKHSKLVLQYASVMGRQFHSKILGQVIDSKLGVSECLDGLQERGLVFKLQKTSDENEDFVFKHALTQDVAYQSILKRDRKIFHEHIGFEIEGQVKRCEEHAETLARHFTMSSNKEKALEYSRMAAQQMAAAFNNDGAIKHYQTAIKLVEGEISADQAESQLVNLCLELAEIFVLIGDFEEAESYQRKVLKLSLAESDLTLQSKCYRRLGDIARFRGKLDDMLNLLQKALHLSLEAVDEEGIYRTYKALGFAYKTSNDLHEAFEYLGRALEGARRLQLLPLVAECLNDIATVKIDEHALDEAEKYLLESVEISSKIPKLRSLVVSSTLNLGVIEYYRSNFDQALLKFQEASKIAQQIGDLKNLLISKHNIGEILREFGRNEEAIVEFQASYELAKDMGNEIEKVNNLILIGYLKTRLGEAEAGEKILRDSILECQSKRYWLYYCDALFFLGRYYSDEGQTELAKEAFESSRAKACEIQANHAIQRCDEALSKLLNSSPASGSEQASDEALT